MAEQQDDSQEKTEEPSEQKKRRAQEEGRTIHSKDLLSLAALAAAFGALAVQGQAMVSSLTVLLRQALLLQTSPEGEVALLNQIGNAGIQTLGLLLTVAVPVAVAVLLFQFGVGGFNFSWQALEPKFKRLNPLSGLARLFGKQALYELAKTMAKSALVLAVIYWVFSDQWTRLGGLIHTSLPGVTTVVTSEIWRLVRALLGVALLFALIDLTYQWWQHRQSMMMTKQEARDEHRQSEGSPELRARIRQMRREITMARSSGGVRDATVVLVNPTHFLIALSYQAGEDQPPTVCAKAQGKPALKLQEEARALGIPVHRQPDLTRAIFFTCDVGHSIREELFQAVAVILAHVLNGAEGEPPTAAPPTEFLFDETGRRLRSGA